MGRNAKFRKEAYGDYYLSRGSRLSIKVRTFGQLFVPDPGECDENWAVELA
jgi:hypothetical protein